MTTYNNGPGNVPRLPEFVVDQLVNDAGVSRLAYDDKDQSAQVERLVHDTCEELLARLPAAQPVEAAGGAVQAEASQITGTESARKFVDAWHRKHFPTDRTFTRYIMNDPARSNPLASDFAWQLAKALEAQAATHPAEPVGGALVASADYVLMPRTLTAENGAKGALSGEFVESITVTCHECEGVGEVEDGYKCAECDGEGTVEQRVAVEWDTIKRIYALAVALLAGPATGALVAKPEPVELMGVREQIEQGAGFWHSCSGCHETEDGHPVGQYAYSNTLGCALGNGCSECGGIGAVWDNNDYEAMAKDWDNAAPTESAAAPADQLDEDASEGLELLDDLIANIEKDGNYSKEATLTFLGQVRQCFATHQPTTQAEGM